MLEKKNIRVLDDVLDSFRQGQGKHVEKQGDNWNVTELLGCRRKVEFRRANTPYKLVESDFSRQGKLGSLLHTAVQVELRKMNWMTEVKFVKKIGKYTLHCRVDGIRYGDVLKHEVYPHLIELKFPMWNSTAKKGIPDYFKIQVGAYLNITSAEDCKLMIMARNMFSEHVLTESLSDEDIVWMIEEGAMSPSFDAECGNCFYEELCDISKKKK